MTDPTENARKQMLAEINAEPGSREYLEAKHGQVWDTSELSDSFVVLDLPPRWLSCGERATA